MRIKPTTIPPPPPGARGGSILIHPRFWASLVILRCWPRRVIRSCRLGWVSRLSLLFGYAPRYLRPSVNDHTDIYRGQHADGPDLFYYP